MSVASEALRTGLWSAVELKFGEMSTCLVKLAFPKPPLISKKSSGVFLQQNIMFPQNCSLKLY